MKHGRVVPFERRREKDRYYYVGTCGHCGKEYKLGAPRWLPDEVVVEKLYQKGMAGEGYLDKGIPRYLYCSDCPVAETNYEGQTMENVLFSNLPARSQVRVRRVEQNPGYWAVRFALPQELGDLIRESDYRFAVRLVRVGSGYVRFKIKPVEDGDIKRGGPQRKLDGDATRWYALRLGKSSTRPSFTVSLGLVEKLIDQPVSSFAGNLDIELERYSPHNYKEGSAFAFAYDCATLGYRIGDTQPVPDAEEQEEEAPPEELPQPAATGEVPEESIPKGVETTFTERPSDPQTAESVAAEYSVDDSMQVIHRDLENVNLHLMNLQDKGWQPEITIEDNHIRVRVTKVLS